MTQLLISLTDIRILDVIDILIVLILVWQIYKLLRGTIAFNIFIGLMLLYGVWYAVSFFNMRLLTFLLGPFVGFGVLILIIIFQPEIRQFLLLLGNNTLKNRFTFIERLWGDQIMVDDSAIMNIVDEVTIGKRQSGITQDKKLMRRCRPKCYVPSFKKNLQHMTVQPS